MTREEMKPGDLVEAYGKRWVVGERRFWSGSPQYVWGWPATKAGRADQRKDGGYIDPERCKLINREGGSDETA